MDQYNYLSIFGGITIGGVVYFLILTIFDQIMWYTADCESLGAFDAIFLLDDKSNRSNNLGVLTFEQFDFESMRDHLINKTETVHKCRSKLVKKFGVYWFQKMDPKEWLKKKDDVIVKVENIHNEQ